MINYFIKSLSPTLLRPINMPSELHNELLTGNLLWYKDSIKYSIAVAKHAEILSHFFTNPRIRQTLMASHALMIPPIHHFCTFVTLPNPAH